MVINELISAILQLGLFTLVPFIVFQFRNNKSVNFTSYIGLCAPTRKSILLSIVTVIILIIGAVGVIFLNEDLKAMVFAPGSVTGKLRRMGFGAETLTILLIIALVKTSLSEEIFFRGFIAHRLTSGLGFNAGNLIQALIFGSIHLLLFWKLVGALPFPLTFIFVFSTFGGWVIGYIKDKYANGSIIPGWIAHGIANVSSYSIIAFVM